MMRVACSTNVLRLALNCPARRGILHPASNFRRNLSGVTVNVEHARDEWKSYGSLDTYKPGKFHVKCFNNISQRGLSKLTEDNKYDILQDGAGNVHAILLETHTLKEEEVAHTVRAIARCGASTNNVPVRRMSELGIPVFNTPGANANAVKELLLCSLLLGSRKIIHGVNHMKELGRDGLARERVEKDKAMFGGREIAGRTLAVIGLGHIGSSTALDADTLGMSVVGYDPALTVEAALQLPPSIQIADSISSAVANADYIALIIPYIEGEGGTRGIINADIIDNCKSDAVFLNVGPSELVDSEAMKAFLDGGDGRYIADFPDDLLWDHPNCIIFPHLGASTGEAADAAAAMAADILQDFLETGTIRNSVNFPEMVLPERTRDCVRFTVVNRNIPGALAAITDSFAQEGVNIVQQINQSKGDIAYTAVDIDITGHDDMCFKRLQEDITMRNGVLSSRIIHGKPGTGYAKNLDGRYFV